MQIIGSMLASVAPILILMPRFSYEYATQVLSREIQAIIFARAAQIFLFLGNSVIVEKVHFIQNKMDIFQQKQWPWTR